jgi:hypothetical protein
MSVSVQITEDQIKRLSPEKLRELDELLRGTLRCGVLFPARSGWRLRALRM